MEDHKYLGVATVDGQGMKHFSATKDDQYLAEGDYVNWEFWVDDSGQVRQYKTVDYAQGIMGEDSIKTEMIGVISKINEPITITAPTVP